MSAIHSGSAFADPGLNTYLANIYAKPILAPEEEYELGRRWHLSDDRRAADRLIQSHLRLVAKIAMGYRGYGLPLDEMVSAGSLGLTQAVQNFDPDRGARLSTYATWWIRAAIQEYILSSWSLVKIGTTLAQKKLFFNLRRCKRELGLDQAEMPAEAARSIADTLEVKPAEVLSMERRLSGRDSSLNMPVDEAQGIEVLDCLVEPGPSQERLLADREERTWRHHALSDALKVLNPRELDIVRRRHLAERPQKLHELAEKYGVSRERVRQIETRAIQKLRQAMSTGTPVLAAE